MLHNKNNPLLLLNKKPFTRSAYMYKEYLAEFWYSAIALENSKVSFSIPNGGIYEEVGVNTFRNAIGVHYLPHSSEYVAPPSIDIVRQWFPTIRYEEEVSAKGTLRKSLLPPSLENGINNDYASIFWEDITIKLNKRHKEKVVPYTRFLSLLMMHKMKEGYRDDHMLAICSATKPVVFKAHKPFSNTERVSQGTKPGAKPGYKKHSTSLKQPSVSRKEFLQLKLILEKSTPSDFVPQQQGLETILTQPITRKGASSIVRQVEEDEASRTIKLEDLAKLVSSVQPHFKDLDTPKDDPIVVVDDSAEDKDADEVHGTTNVEIEDLQFLNHHLSGLLKFKSLPTKSSFFNLKIIN
nr:hypothetical protein [Tanacetum cinerariifolium]